MNSNQKIEGNTYIGLYRTPHNYNILLGLFSLIEDGCCELSAPVSEQSKQLRQTTKAGIANSTAFVTHPLVHLLVGNEYVCFMGLDSPLQMLDPSAVSGFPAVTQQPLLDE